MRSNIVLALSIVVLGFLNFGIYQKQKIIDHGDVVLLELTPVDPRSLMQGDYMRLRYAIERSKPAKTTDNKKKRGHMVVKPDKNKVAQFVRFHQGEALNDREYLLSFHRDHNRVRIVPDSFMFQEGHAEYYENAKYGVFRFDKNGKHLLVGLADSDGQRIVVAKSK